MAKPPNVVEDGRLVRPTPKERQGWWNRRGWHDPKILCATCGLPRSENLAHFGGRLGHFYVARIPEEETNG